MDNLRNVYARNCCVRRIDSAEAEAFLSRYHRIGWTPCRYRYGLFVRCSTGAREEALPVGTLVAVAGFSNPRRWQKGERKISSCEWVRYASVEGVRVVGGMSRLLKAFLEEVHPDDVMTYADPSSVDCGKVYETLGFECEGTVEKPGFRCLKYRLKLTDAEY